MNAVFKKLNYKAQPEIYVLNAPESFNTCIMEMQEEASVAKKLPAKGNVAFVLAFAITQSELDEVVGRILKTAAPDALIWIAYPKKSSKKYTCDFNRDTGWEPFAKAGYEPVRMIAIDEDWSALRFKKVEDIKSMKRSFAISEKGKDRVAAEKKKAGNK